MYKIKQDKNLYKIADLYKICKQICIQICICIPI